jgi:serine/threonine-protein kinase
MALRTRVWGAGKIVLLVGALAATYVVFAAASMRLAIRTREVEVPNLTNRSANEATGIANDLGLALTVDDSRRADSTVAAGRVLAQEPVPGSVARRQRSIRVWLSGGVRAASMPLLIGETERAAQLRATQDGIALATVAEIHSPDYPSDVVVAQTPAPKAAAARVSLLVNRGDSGPSFVMPDLIGVDGDRAADILRGRGFRVAVMASSPYPGVAAGVVLRQSPQGGFRIAPGEAVSLEVSR